MDDRSCLSSAPRYLLLAGLLASFPAAAVAQECTGLPAVESLGLATYGSQGLPALAMEGAPGIGGPFQLRVLGLEPGAGGFLLLGTESAPQYWSLADGLVLPAGLLRVIPFAADATGCSPALFAVGAVPLAACGVDLVAQASVSDAAAVGGFALTKAARFQVGASSSSPGFAGPYGIMTGLKVFGLVLADLDGDQKMDALTGTSGAAYGFAPGLGDGSFGAPLTFAAGLGPEDIEVVDLDLDQVPDLVAATNPVFQPSNRFSVVMGLGGGAFAAPLVIPTGLTPSAVASGDVNGDGFPDVAVVTTSMGGGDPWIGGKVEIHLGQGDGTLAAPLVIVPGKGPIDGQLADLDLDGFLDLVTGDQYKPASGGYDPAVAVMLGNGDGTFAPATIEPVPSAQKVTVRDLTLDGLPDVAVVNTGVPPTLEILLGLGGGDLAAPLSSPVPHAGSNITLGDFDGDLWPDVAVASSYLFTVELLAGDGSGLFGPSSVYPGPLFGFLIASADLDLDLDPDLAVGDALGSDVYVLENRLVP